MLTQIDTQGGDQDGKLSKAELKKFLASLGIAPRKEEREILSRTATADQKTPVDPSIPGKADTEKGDTTA